MTAAIQRNIFCTDLMPENPDNNQYLPVIDASSYPAISVANRLAPRFSMHTCLKPLAAIGPPNVGWADHKLLNSLLGVGTDNNTDKFACAMLDEVETRIYDWSRCERVDFAHNAAGGPCAVMLGFKSRWGDEDGPYGTTLPGGEVIGVAPAFTYTGQVPDAGEVMSPTHVSVVGVDKCKGFQLTFLRGQAAQYYYSGGKGPDEISSTMFTGVCTIDQDPDASTQITNTGTIVITFNTDMTATTGRFKVTLLLKRDNRYKPHTSRLGNVTTTFSMFDQAGGGNPALFAAI